MTAQKDFNNQGDNFYIWEAFQGINNGHTIDQFNDEDMFYWYQVILLGGGGGGSHIIGDIDASTNPNYPAAVKGDTYRISVKGKIGGASGAKVEAGDLVIAFLDNAGGTQGAVGTSWNINEFNLEQIFEINGNDFSESVVRDLTDTIGRDHIISVGRNRTSTITGDDTFNVTGSRVVSISTNDSLTITGSRVLSIGVNNSETISGNETIGISGSRSVTIGTTDGLTIIGNRTVSIGGTETFGVTASRSVTIGTTDGLTIVGTRTVSIGGNDVFGVTGTKTDTIGVKYVISTPFVGINQNNPDVALSVIGQVILQNANNITANSAQVNIYTSSISFPIGLWARSNLTGSTAYGIISEALGAGNNIGIQADTRNGATNKSIVVPANNPNAGASNWALWIQSNAQNYFEGNIGIGIALPTEKLEVIGNIKTANPGGGSGAWKLGKVIVGAVVPDGANYVETQIDGAVVKLIIAA